MSLEIPNWLGKIFSVAHLLTEGGIEGITEHARNVNRLGELLAKRQVTAEQLGTFIAVHEGNEPIDERAYWSSVWSEILGRNVEVPAPPQLKQKTVAAIKEYRLRLVFLPKITEDDYPERFVKYVWDRYLEPQSTTRRPLEGRWVLVETIAKPDWDDPQGYGDDPLGKALGIDTRFKKSWDELHETTLPAASKLLGLSNRQARCTTAEEWNLIGNLFNWLREHRGEDLPDLGSTNSWEWCENAFGSEHRLVAGDRDDGGLAAVHRVWSYVPSDDLAFRVLAVL